MLGSAIDHFLLRTGSRAAAGDVRRLERTLARIAAAAGGRVGAACVHLETGRTVSINGAERFPLASTVKIPVALRMLERVARGELALDTMLDLEPGHLRPGAGIVARSFRVPGVALSVQNLLELSLIGSDNTAADVLFTLAGGPASVQGFLKALDLDMSVDRTILQLLADIEGIDDLPAGGVTPKRWRTLIAAVPAERRTAAERAFFDDRRDTATPEAMTQLLSAVWTGRVLGADLTSLLLDVLARCETGGDRLRGLLPPGVRVAHKTGTIEGARGRGARWPRVVNDVGIVSLPGDAGHVAVAAFVKASARDAQSQARAIARIARAAYDCFV